MSATASVTVTIGASSGFDPRTMTVAQIAAVTGLQVDPATLKKAGVTTVGAGTYENMDYSGRVTVETTGKVLFRNCRFNTGGNDDYTVLNIPERYLAQEIRFEYCELSGATNCIAGANLYVYRCEITNWDNAINIWGPSQIVENFIHTPSGAAGGHYDGIEDNGGNKANAHGSITILRNYIENPFTQTSALMFNNEFGPLHDILIDGNYLSGGGYTVYFDTSKSSMGVPCVNVKVTNNTLKKGFYGWAALYNSGVTIDASGGNALI